MEHSKQYSPMSTTKAVASYMLLPRFWPRLVGFAPRFGLIAYLMAIIFESVKLLPKGNKFTLAQNMNSFRIRDVLAMAANNLHGGFKNSDQYIIFGMFLIGVVLLGLQFVFLFAMIATRTAEAAGFTSIFITPNTQIDIAHLMLDKVFGIPAFFNSCFDPAINSDPLCASGGAYIAPTSFPDQFQTAMQALFRFYSMGMIAVAGFVVLYFIVAMILETANTGVPFGKRFQSVFTPLRLVMAILLLLPLAYGYNTGQYVVLLSAKYGSAFATNAWLLFNKKVGDNPMGMTPKELIGQPKVGDISSVLNFMYLAKTCSAGYSMGFKDINNPNVGVTVQPYLVRPASSTVPAASMVLTAGTTFDSARNFFGQGDVQIVFGEKKAEYTDLPGEVRPLCGVILMPALSKQITGIQDIYNVYFKNVLDIWNNTNIEGYGMHMACVLAFKGNTACTPAAMSTTVLWNADDNKVAGPQFYIDLRTTVQATFEAQLKAQLTTLRSTTNPQITMDANTLLRGWGGAGLWFNKVMAFNGAMVDALQSLPTPTQYPMIMEYIAKKKKQETPGTDKKDVFSLTMSNSKETTSLDKYMSDSSLGGDQTQNVVIGKLLNDTYKQIQETPATSRAKEANSDSAIKNFVTLLFGQTGIFDFRANSEVFPLAKLAMLGRELIDKTVIMLASRAVMAGAGTILGADMGPMSDVMKAAGPSMGTFATMGVSIGVLLYYVVPLMPFIYFFFAVGRWVKSIFEAMVAVPLWALAHLRLGGEGIPGPAAGQGYFLILEIFLRPILTLFGLMASIGIFMAMSYGLDSVFNLVVMNTGGYDMTTLSSGGADPFFGAARDGMDALFYTVLYAVLVYTIATSSFKLIDDIPNSIMRWGGSNTSSFNAQTDAISQVNYNVVYKADAMARDIDSQIKGAHDAGDNFNDIKMRQEQLKNK